jgi:hypothetical protein
MECVVFVLLFVSGFPMFDPALWPQPHPSTPQFWKETESETLWTTRYSNEDYGFCVLLQQGVIGHGTHSPASNHGFLVPLPDIGRQSQASSGERRFVWVDASYNTSEDRSLSGVASHQVHLMDDERGKPHVIERRVTKLGGLTAIFFKSERPSPQGTAVEEQVIASRSGIIYTIGLQTTENYAADDEKQFRTVLSGFRLLDLHDRAKPQLRMLQHPLN